MNEDYQEYEFTAQGVDERLDKVLAARFETLSRAQIQSLIRDGLVTVNAGPVKASYRLVDDDVVGVRVPIPEEEHDPQPETIPLVILYEDETLAVIDKPAGMVVHPAYGHTSGTLVNAVLARWPQIATFDEPERAGIVHRLDKETSGVILVAKTEDTRDALQDQFKERQVQKRYLALVDGMPDTPEGRIDAPIGRDPKQRKRMAVTRDGREAVTEYYVLEHFANHSLMEVFPKTGRTHQIRVHMAFIGNPIVGDTVYGHRKQPIKMKRHFLHAAAITFAQPSTGDMITVESPLPVPLQDVLNKLPR